MRGNGDEGLGEIWIIVAVVALIGAIVFAWTVNVPFVKRMTMLALELTRAIMSASTAGMIDMMKTMGTSLVEKGAGAAEGAVT